MPNLLLIEAGVWRDEAIKDSMELGRERPIFYNMDELMLRGLKPCYEGAETVQSRIREITARCHTVMVWGWCSGNDSLTHFVADEVNGYPRPVWALGGKDLGVTADNAEQIQVRLDDDPLPGGADGRDLRSAPADPRFIDELCKALRIAPRQAPGSNSSSAVHNGRTERQSADPVQPPAEPALGPPLHPVRKSICLLRPERIRDKVAEPLEAQSLRLAVICADGPASGAGVPAEIAERLRSRFPRFRLYPFCQADAAAGLIAPNSGMTHTGELMISLRFDAGHELADWPRMARVLRERMVAPDLGLAVFVAPRAWFEAANAEFERQSRSVVLSLSAIDLLSVSELSGCLANLFLTLVPDEQQQQLCLERAQAIATDIRRALNGSLDGAEVDLVHLLVEKWYLSERELPQPRSESDPAEAIVDLSRRAATSIVGAVRSLRKRVIEEDEAVSIDWRRMEASASDEDEDEAEIDAQDFDLDYKKVPDPDAESEPDGPGGG